MSGSSAPAMSFGFNDGSLPIAVGAFLGAALSVLVAELTKYFIARRSKRDALRLDHLRDATVDVTSNARRMLHAVGSRDVHADKEVLASAHEAVRIGVDQLQLVGDARVQRAAMLIRHHAYALRSAGEGSGDPHEEYLLSPYRRMEQAVENLLAETRRSLAVGGVVASKPNYGDMTTSLAAKRSSIAKGGKGRPEIVVVD